MRQIMSFGGGVNSMAMLVEGARRGDLPDRILFADTGSEWPETMAYLEQVAQPFARQHGLEIEIIRAEVAGGSLYEYAKAMRMVPIRQIRWCTGEFKIKPLERESAAKDGDPVCRWVGIDAGEQRRAKGYDKSKSKREIRDNTTLRYPLIEWGLDRQGCAEVIRRAGLPTPMKSGCYFCPFARKKQFVDLARRHPALFAQTLELEENSLRFGEGMYLTGLVSVGAKPLREWISPVLIHQGVLFEPNELGALDEDEDDGEDRSCGVCEVGGEDPTA